MEKKKIQQNYPLESSTYVQKENAEDNQGIRIKAQPNPRVCLKLGLLPDEGKIILRNHITRKFEKFKSEKINISSRI